MAEDRKRFREEIDILMWYFNLVGLPLYRNKRRGGLASSAKFCLNLLSECFFWAFGVYVAYNSVIGCPDRSWFIKLTTSSMSVLVVALRLVVSRKRSQILAVLDELGRFADTCRYRPVLRREIRLTCFTSIAFPLASSWAFLVLMVGGYDDMKHQLKPDLVTVCGGWSSCVFTSVFLISAAYAFHFFVVPSLCMMLFFFVYVRYESALSQTLLETHQRLMSDLSLEAIERSMSLVVRATRLHGLIEGALSLGVFVTYVLVFVNFLNVVVVHVTALADELVPFRSLGCAFVFAWTTAGFFRMTFTGSKLADACERWRGMQMDIALACIRLERDRRDEFLHLMLFNDAAKLELRFTGWGMFSLKRSLVLSMAEIIVSYGVLIATI